MRAGSFVKSDGTNGHQSTRAGSQYVARHSPRQRSLPLSRRLCWLWLRQSRKPCFDTRGYCPVNLLDERGDDCVAVLRSQLLVYRSGRQDVLGRYRGCVLGRVVLIDGLPPGGGVGLARRRHAPASCCPDLVVRHRALFPVATSRRQATVK
jgi:hypothetical protein